MLIPPHVAAFIETPPAVRLELASNLSLWHWRECQLFPAYADTIRYDPVISDEYMAHTRGRYWDVLRAAKRVAAPGVGERYISGRWTQAMLDRLRVLVAQWGRQWPQVPMAWYDEHAGEETSSDEWVGRSHGRGDNDITAITSGPSRGIACRRWPGRRDEVQYVVYDLGVGIDSGDYALCAAIVAPACIYSTLAWRDSIPGALAAAPAMAARNQVNRNE
jgi:hypothetical protein